MAVATHSAHPTDPGQAPNSPTVYYRRLPESALSDRRLTRTALSLLAQLDGYARDRAECWPSVMTLATALDVCRRTVQLALSCLKKCGYIDEKPATNPTGRVLILLWKTGGAKPVAPGRKPRTPRASPGRKNSVRPKESQSSEGRKASRSALFKTPEPDPIPPPRPVEPRPTQAEKADALRDWLASVSPGSPLARSLTARLAERLKL